MSLIPALRSVGIDDPVLDIDDAAYILTESKMVPGSNPTAFRNALTRWTQGLSLIELIVAEHQYFDRKFEPLDCENRHGQHIYHWNKK